jgi:hypothetical protein
MMALVAPRVVVGFLTRVTSGALEAGDVYLSRVAGLCQRAEALGGRLCAFGSQSVAFEFSSDEVEEALFLALGERTEQGASMEWRMGLAEGEMSALAPAGPLAGLGWGPPLVTAIALARIAKPGELLVDPDLGAVVRGDIATTEERIGKDLARGVRGLVVDPRGSIGAHRGEGAITELARPELVGQHATLHALLEANAPLAVVRAAPGLGGTRLLTEIEASLSPARSLYLSTAGAEPLGALRRAFARSIAISGRVQTLSAGRVRALERLLSGEGVDVRLASDLITRWISEGTPGSGRSGAVLLDDAMEIDDPSLDAVACAAKLDAGTLLVVARIDENASPPPPLQSIEMGPMMNLGPLPRSSAEELVASASRGNLGVEARRRWARRGRFVPLGIMEALAEGMTSGELSGLEGVPTPRIGAASLLMQLEPKEWILRRLRALGPAKRLLRAVAILGVEATSSLADELASALGVENASDEAERLAREGWLSLVPAGFYVLPSHTHRETILAEIPDDERAAWHDAASRVVERTGGTLATAEAARHAALAGDQKRAVELALVAAKASRRLELEAATEALLAFAGASVDDLAPPPARPSGFRLMSWIDALRASGDRDGAASRLQAIASLAKGETSEALAALREGVHLADGAPPAARSRALLAYGIALAVAGRPTEALFSALEALARAREGGEPHGAEACARFLARLTSASGHRDAAEAWERAAGGG